MLVLDTDAAIAIAKGDAQGELFRSFIENSDEVICSEIMLIECAHVAQKYVKAQAINSSTAKEWLVFIQGLVDRVYSVQPDVLESLHEALRLNHSPYDIFPLILAKRYNATLVSLDQKLINLCVSEGLSVCTEVSLD